MGASFRIRSRQRMDFTTTPDALTVSGSAGELTLDGLLAFTAMRGGSDLFIKAGAPPVIKVNGNIQPTDFPVLTEADSRRLAFEHLDEGKQSVFVREREMNLSFTVTDVSRIR